MHGAAEDDPAINLVLLRVYMPKIWLGLELDTAGNLVLQMVTLCRKKNALKIYLENKNLKRHGTKLS